MRFFKRGQTYWFEFVYNGQRYQESSKTKNRRAAEDIGAAFRVNLARGEAGIKKKEPKKIPTFKTAMSDFLEWFERENTKHPSTFIRHQTSSVALLKHFKDESLDMINPAAVERFKHDRLQQRKTKRSGAGRVQMSDRIKPATVNRELALLRAVFSHAMKEDDLPLKNPVGKQGVKALNEENESTRVLTFEEQARYLACATPVLRDVATMILETGMRPDEVCRIQPENVRLDEGTLFVPFGKTRAAKRRIRLTTAAREIVARRLKACEVSSSAYLFPHAHDSKRPMPKVNNAHDRSLRASKVERFRLYDLRHTWATRAAEAGIDLVTLASMLGHSKINMVLRYAHPTQEHQTRAMEKLEMFVAERRSADVSQRVQ